MNIARATADVAVVGLGAHGLATAASLARRGHSVIGLDQFAPGHGRGSSHGRTRMIRRAYPNPVWNDLVDRAFQAWAELEVESGQTLVHRTGGLYAHRGASQLQGPNCRVVEDPEELAAHMPGLRIPRGYRAVHDPDAGVIEAERALAALRAAADAHGAQLRHDVKVRGWDSSPQGVAVATDAGVVHARRVVVAGGSWAGRLVPQLAPLLEVWRILTVTVSPGQRDGMPPALGSFSIDRPEGLVFGIPDANGNGVKLGVDAGEVWDPEDPVAMPSQSEIRTLQDLLAQYVPGLNVDPVEVAACLYTMTADRRFILGPLADAPEVIVASACSGHGFKFAPAIGDALADLATDVARPDLEFVSTERRGL